MKLKRITGRAFALLLTLTLVLTLCSAVFAAAAETPAAAETSAAAENAAATGSITVSMQLDGKAVTGMTLRLYAVAQEDVDALCAETMTVAQVSEKYAAGKALSEGATKDGKLTFSSLGEGVYLILGSSFTDADGMEWGAEPLLVQLPNPDKADTDPMNRQVNGKPVKGKERTVVKKWSGDTESARPASITVNLKKNGTVVDTIILKPENGVWSYTWSQERLQELGGEDWASAEWSVNEKTVPTGYTATVTGFTITNTYSTSGGNLPKTGLDWLPVLLLAAAGVLCITVGILRRRKQS